MAIKIFCDFCEKEITGPDSNSCGVVQVSSLKTTIDKNTGAMIKTPAQDKYELCQQCFDEFEETFNNLKEKDGGTK